MNLIITNEFNKMDILKKLTDEKKFNNYKFYSFNELKKKLFFDYDNKTIEYVMKKYNVNLSIAKIYIENLYFLKDVRNKKIEFLNNLKKELDNNKLLIYNNQFKNYLLGKKIIVYQNEELSKEEKYILKDFNYKVKKNQDSIYSPEIFEAININEELEFVISSIKKLIHEGIDINNIKLIANSEYNKYLEYYSQIFGLPLNTSDGNSFFSTGVSNLFLRMYDEYDIPVIIEKLKEKYENINELISVINKSVLVSDKKIRKEFIIDDLKKCIVSNVSYKNAIDIHSLHENYTDDDYVFLLGFNIGNYPKIYMDDDFLSDKEKKMLDLDTSIEKNKMERVNVISAIKRIPHLIITYPLHDGSKVRYPSVLIDDLQVTSQKIKLNRSISYSKKYSNLLYAIDLDNFYKYNDESKYLKMYQRNLNIPYREYNNKYNMIDTDLLKERLNDNFTLSYTSLESFNECGFKYYLSRIMNLDIYEETFKIIIGKIVHHILEKGLEKCIDIDMEISEFMKTLDFSFGPRELFYVHKLSAELDYLLKYLHKQEKNSKLTNYLFETELAVEKKYNDINVVFKGFIDKVMSTEYKGKEVIAVVDYKTGDKNIKLDTLEYGLNIQLPIYLYLLKNSERFKDSVIAGFYIEKVLNNVFNITKNKSLEELKNENLRLQGYTNSDENIISLIDTNYLNSKMIKGLKFKKDGSFYSTSKVLSNKEMDDMIVKVQNIIDDTIKNVITGKFFINPKVLKGKNISCTYCKFKDICFKTKSDEVIIGGEDDEFNA